MTMLHNALAAGHVILSSAGTHAQQEWQEIIARKAADIAHANHTIWVVNSNATRPEKIQPFCNDNSAHYVIFVGRARPRPKSREPGPVTKHHAAFYSQNRTKWTPISFWPKDPNGLSEVTGRITAATAGFWFEALEEIDSGQIDLRSYVKPNGEVLDGFQKHESAYPVRRHTDVGRKGYEILAVGRLTSPFAVWLKRKRTR